MPLAAFCSPWGLCALVDVSALAIMILDPSYRSMSMHDAAIDFASTQNFDTVQGPIP
jgi:hypothetical protein